MARLFWVTGAAILWALAQPVTAEAAHKSDRSSAQGKATKTVSSKAGGKAGAKSGKAEKASDKHAKAGKASKGERHARADHPSRHERVSHERPSRSRKGHHEAVARAEPVARTERVVVERVRPVRARYAGSDLTLASVTTPSAADTEEVVAKAQADAELLPVAGTAQLDPVAGRLMDAMDATRASGRSDEPSLVVGPDIRELRKKYDIPVEDEGEVLSQIRYFQTTGRKTFLRWLGRSSQYLPLMHDALNKAGVPEDIVYLSMIESGFSPHALSWCRASGLWQFMAPTGRLYGLENDFWVDERRDPVKATQAAASYLKDLYTQFGDWRLAWASYNAGPGKVRRALQQSESFWGIARGGVLKRETKQYVPRLMAAALISKNLELFGFSKDEVIPSAPLVFDTVRVPPGTDLDTAAQAAGVTAQALRDLNPELKHWAIPPQIDGSTYALRLPKGKGAAFADNFPDLAEKSRLTFKVHRIARGDTIARIAMKYDTLPEAIMRHNNLVPNKRLRTGAQLAVPIPQGDVAKELLADNAHRLGFVAPALPSVPEPLVGEPDETVAVVEKRRGEPERREKRDREELARATVAPKRPIVHSVIRGESLFDIARRFNVTVDALKSWNNLQGAKAKVRVGQSIRIFPSTPVS